MYVHIFLLNFTFKVLLIGGFKIEYLWVPVATNITLKNKVAMFIVHIAMPLIQFSIKLLKQNQQKSKG